MKKNTPRKCWRLWIILFTLIGVTLACDTSGVDPKDPRLQAPVSNKGMVLEDFLGQLDIAPRGFISVPWITSPEDYSHNAPPAIEVKGWAKYYRDGEIVVYQVVPNDDMRGVYTVGKKLASAEINKKDLSWSTTIQLPDERQFLAARIERKNGKYSGFSNIIYVSTGEPIPLTITSPKMDEVTNIDTVNLTGSGEPGIGLEVYVNGEKTNLSTKISVEGEWEIKDVPLLMTGFDKPGTIVNYLIDVKADGTGQVANINIKRIEAISLLWPFDKGVGTITSLYGNDWHMFARNGDHHPALDISTASGYVAGKKIHAVAAGTVVQSNWTAGEGGYVVIDSGSFGVLYLHIIERPQNKDYPAKGGLTEEDCKGITAQEYPPKVTVGQKVTAGQIIGTEGFTHKCRGNSYNYKTHLHIQVFVWGKDVNKSTYGTVYKQEGVNINPPITQKELLAKKNINLYDWWGGGDYCDTQGCWKDVDWTNVFGRTVTSEYANGCLEYISDKTQNPAGYSSVSTRARYCSLQESNCLCENYGAYYEE